MSARRLRARLSHHMSCCALGTEPSQKIRVERGGLALALLRGRGAPPDAAEAAEGVEAVEAVEAAFLTRFLFFLARFFLCPFPPLGLPPPPPPPPASILGEGRRGSGWRLSKRINISIFILFANI